MKKIFIISQVKNESDVIESFCRYNLTYSDGILIYDNKSYDSTKFIIQQLIKEGLNIHLVNDDNLNKIPFVNNIDRMAHCAIDVYHADLIIPLDADEFLCLTKEGSLRNLLENLDENKSYQALWRTYICERELNDNSIFLPDYFDYYRDPCVEIYSKVLVSKKMIQQYGAKFGIGNHHIANAENAPIGSINLNDLVFAHYPLRSTFQAMIKVTTGWYGYMEFNRKKNLAYHWRDMYEHIKSKGPFTLLQLSDLSKKYAFINQNIGVKTIKKPLVSKPNKKLRLKYTDYKEKEEFLLYVLTYFEERINLYHSFESR